MPSISFAITPLAILMVFYLYMLTRFKYVRRPMFYLWGSVAIAGGMTLAGLVLPWVEDPNSFFSKVVQFGTSVAAVISFACIVLACYGGTFPEEVSRGQRVESMDEDELPEFLEEASQVQQRD